MSVVIKSLQAYKEYDSHGNTTVAGKLILSDGREFTASIANHLNKRKLIAQYLDVDKSLHYINELLSPKLVNTNPQETQKIDHWLESIDQSERKEIIGLNTTLLVSKLVYRAAASVTNVPLYSYLRKVFSDRYYSTEIKKLPIPIFTLIGGALHGSQNLNFQEFSIVFSSSLSYAQAVEQGAAMHIELQKVFEYRNIFAGVGVDGAYVPNLSSNFDALEIIKEALLKRGYKLGLDIFFALDVAASFFYKGGKYYVSEEAGSLDTSHLLDLYEKIFKEYRFLILEDPFAEGDSAGWKMAVEKFGDKAYILGDDLLLTNMQKLEKAVKDKLCTLADIKMTHQPTIGKLLEFLAHAKKLMIKTTISQTAIETNDDFLADLAVGTQVDYVKFGPPVRGERVAKHNRLLTIERELKLHD